MSNRSGTTYSAPRDADRNPVVMGVSTVDGITPVPLEVNPSTGQLQTSGSGGGGGGGSTTNSATYSGQLKPNTTATALGSTTGLTNGVIVQALSGNTASVYVGPTGVSATTGMELQAGQATSIGASTLGQVYVIAQNSADGVAWLGN